MAEANLTLSHAPAICQPKQIRFWHYHNGEAVLIKLRAGQSLQHYTGSPTDEGWSSEFNRWSFDGEIVTSQWRSDGCDCDGRLTSYGEAFFTADAATAGYCDEESIRFPAWQQGERGQRDYSAEAMGY